MTDLYIIYSIIYIYIHTILYIQYIYIYKQYIHVYIYIYKEFVCVCVAASIWAHLSTDFSWHFSRPSRPQARPPKLPPSRCCHRGQRPRGAAAQRPAAAQCSWRGGGAGAGGAGGKEQQELQDVFGRMSARNMAMLSDG